MQWTLGWGGNVKVEGPESFRHQIYEEIIKCWNAKRLLTLRCQ
ncbi:hypothetical protein ACWIE6_16855 [Paenibacillus taichungensis]